MRPLTLLVPVAVALLGGARPAAAQLDSETLLDSAGYATTLVHNRSPGIVDVEVELRHGSVTAERIELGDRVNALVSPGRFQLAPGESQVVRLLVRERLASDSVLRLVTTLTPKEARELPPADSDSVSGARARLFYATRLITKVRSR